MQTTIQETTTQQTTSQSLQRIDSIDVLRGIVMILMAIDHVRVYSGVPAGGPDAAVFFTRWVTHFCAPCFAFFAGTSAFLYFSKTRNRIETIQFLLTRGLLLVVLELTVVRFSWTFNLDFTSYTLAGVIWMLGWSMILLAPFVMLKARTVAIIGLAIVFFQQLFAYVPEIFPESIRGSISAVWNFFYPTISRNNSLAGTSGLMNVFGISILYVLIPWIGVMMSGYGFGSLLLREQSIVNKYTKWIGIGAIVSFLVIGTIVAMNSGDDMPFLYKLLGQRKYPASQLYLLMTLGPAIFLIGWAQQAKGYIWDRVKIVGRVPMFFYLMHIPLIHLSAFIVNLLVSGTTHQDWYETAPLVWVEPQQQWPLWLLYLVWAIDTSILVRACMWYAGYKKAHPEKVWLKYI